MSPLPFSLQEDLLIHGDSVYDIIDKQDHANIQAELNRNVPPQPGGSSQASSGGAGGAGGAGDSTSSNGSAAGAGGAGGASSLEGEHRMFLCRMNVSRNARRQMRFGDQKVSVQYTEKHLILLLPESRHLIYYIRKWVLCTISSLFNNLSFNYELQN